MAFKFLGGALLIMWTNIVSYRAGRAAGEQNLLEPGVQYQLSPGDAMIINPDGTAYIRRRRRDREWIEDDIKERPEAPKP